MKAYLSRRYQLSASHRLFCGELTAEENSLLFGKCANPHGHGHNYRVEVTMAGELDPRLGMVCDLAALDHCVRSAAVEQYDHTNLNLHPDFTSELPTTENFCIAIFKRLQNAVESRFAAQLVRVRIEETSNNAFTYSGQAETIEARQLARVAERLRTQTETRTPHE